MSGVLIQNWEHSILISVIAFAVKWRRGFMALIYIYTFKLLAHLWIILIRAYLLRSQLNVYLKTMFLRQTEQSVNQSCEWDVEAQSFQVWPVKVSLWAPSPKPHTLSTTSIFHCVNLSTSQSYNVSSSQSYMCEARA